MSKKEIVIERRVFDPTCFDPATIWNNNNLAKDPTDPILLSKVESIIVFCYREISI